MNIARNMRRNWRTCYGGELRRISEPSTGRLILMVFFPTCGHLASKSLTVTRCSRAIKKKAINSKVRQCIL